MAIPEPRVAANYGGREDAIMSHRCIDSPIGCGRLLADIEIWSWDALTQREYLQSGWCSTCQDKIFKDPEEDPDRCTCDDPPCCEADVGVGIITCGDQHRDPCPQHEVDEEFEFRIYEHDILLEEGWPFISQ